MGNVITRRSGPPLHLHYHEDEYSYAIEGGFVMQIGEQRFQWSERFCFGPQAGSARVRFCWIDSSPLTSHVFPAGRMEIYFATRRG
jgi:uncharacterized cupin superfamily protein